MKKKTVPANETRADKFKRLANFRVRRAVGAIGSIVSLSGQGYERTGEQAEKIVTALQAAVLRVEKSFGGEARTDVPII